MAKIKINENCIGCGACTAIAPECFEFSDEGYAKPIKEAAEGCPVSAIEIDEAE